MQRDLVHEWGLTAAETFVLLLLLIRTSVSAWVWLPALTLISVYALLVRYNASSRWRTLTALVVGMAVVVYLGNAIPLVAYGSFWLIRRLHLYDSLSEDLRWCRHLRGLFGSGLFIIAWMSFFSDISSAGFVTLSVLLALMVLNLLLQEPKETTDKCDTTITMCSGGKRC